MNLEPVGSEIRLHACQSCQLSNFSIIPAAIPSPWRPSVLKLSAGFWLRLLLSTGLTFDLSVSFCCSVVVCSFCNCRACLFLSERGRRLSYRLLRTAISSDHSHTIVYSVGISPVLKRYAGRGVFRSCALLLNGMRSLAAFHSPTCHFLQLCFFTERLRFTAFNSPLRCHWSFMYSNTHLHRLHLSH